MMMLVDCSSCPVRGEGCADCMMTALGMGPMGDPQAADDSGAGLLLDRAERRAVSVLQAAGLVTGQVAQAARAVRDPAPVRVRPGQRRAVG